MTAPRIYDPYERINMRHVRQLSPLEDGALYLWTLTCLLAVLGVFLWAVKG